jgi:hypothetical protein
VRVDEFLSAYTTETQEAARRLWSDLRTSALWAKEAGRASFENVVHCFELATHRSEWDRKTARERAMWLADFEKTVDRLEKLISDAPATPKQWGYPVRDNVLMGFLHRFGVPLPPPESNEFFSMMLRAEEAADSLQWSLIDSLEHYRRQVRIDASGGPEVVSKPRDEKADRATFIVMLRRYSKESVRAIATITSVLFNDEAVDERLVRRLTAGNIPPVR